MDDTNNIQDHQPSSTASRDDNLEKKLHDENDSDSISRLEEEEELGSDRKRPLTPSLSRAVSRKSASSWKDPGPPPDGGLLAWTQVAAGFCFILSTWGFIASFGVFQTYYTTQLGFEPSQVSWIGATQIFLLFFVGAFSGRALDAGLFRSVFTVGIVFQLVGAFTTSLCIEYWQLFLAQGLCMGIGNGLAFCPCMALVSTYFSTHKTVALTLAAAGSAPGGMIFPAMVSQLLPRIGFGWTIRIVAFIQLALDLIAFAFLRTRLPPRKSGPIVEWAAFKEFTYATFNIGMFFNFWALYFGFFYVGSFGRERIGLTYPESVNLLITLNGVGIIGRLVPAWLADTKTGPLNTLIPAAFVSGAVVYGWSGVTTTGELYAFAILYGLFINGIQGLFPATLSSLTDDLSKAGVRMGMCFTVVSFACLTGPPLGGALIQAKNGEYLYAQMWAGSSLVLGGIMLIVARISKTGWTFKVQV